jgi:predicted nuclease of predicted toxin-antitoxin system
MKIKLDEHLPARLVAELARLGHDAETVPAQGLGGRPDDQVWTAAQREGRFLITQDMDFSDVRRFKPGRHHGLLLVRLREPGREALLWRIKTLFESEDVATWQRGFVVATDQKLRVRRPSR